MSYYSKALSGGQLSGSLSGSKAAGRAAGRAVKGVDDSGVKMVNLCQNALSRMNCTGCFKGPGRAGFKRGKL